MENYYQKELETSNLIWATFFVILLIAGFYWMTPRTHHIPSYSTSAVLADRELLNPGAFLVATGTYKPDLSLTKWRISGCIDNTAKHTNYKDVVVQLNFYSRANTIIDSKQCVLKDYFSFGTKKEFDLEVDRPLGSVTCAWQAVGGKVY